ncbi:hypothetical protein GQX74_010173 [Glossina fuscipes]|nr:hypothetical protein GQX74_010173 [Glossina fuscipes]
MSTKKNEKRVSTRKKSVLPLKVKIEMLDRIRLGKSFAKKGTPKCPMVREKVKRVYAHFKEPDGSCSGEYMDGEFQASEGWFNKFKVRQSLHKIKIVGVAASADTAAVERYPEECASLVADGGHKPEQVFNADETALFRKRTPNKTFISKGEKSAPGFKAAKDRVTLMLCSNASGDCVIKPLMLYRSKNPTDRLHVIAGLYNGNTKEEAYILWLAIASPNSVVNRHSIYLRGTSNGYASNNNLS